MDTKPVMPLLNVCFRGSRFNYAKYAPYVVSRKYAKEGFFWAGFHAVEQYKMNSPNMLLVFFT